MRLNAWARYSISFSIFGLMGLCLFSLRNAYPEPADDESSLYWLRQVPVEVMAVVNDDVAWQMNLRLNSKLYHQRPNSRAFKCLLDRTDCRGEGGPFLLVDRQGNRVRWTADPMNAADGLTLNGRVCDPLSARGKEKACVIRFTIEWRPFCESEQSCIDPKIKIYGKASLMLERNQKLAITNPNQFSFVGLRKSAQGNLEGFCQASGGSFRQSDSVCLMPAGKRKKTPCPSFSSLVGFGPENEGICKLEPTGLGNLSCPPGHFISAIEKTGRVICSPSNCLSGITKNESQIVQEPTTAPSRKTCSNAMGFFDATSGNCQLSKTGVCPFGVVLNQSENMKVCGMPWPGRCERGYALATVATIATAGDAGAAKCVKVGCEKDTVATEGWFEHGYSANGTELAGKEVRDEQLRNANFSGANLRGLRVRNTHVRRVNFSGADLRGAYFERVVFSSCDFRNSDLSDTTFLVSRCISCKFNRHTKLPMSASQAVKMGFVYVN